jgi:hypothetical protein
MTLTIDGVDVETNAISPGVVGSEMVTSALEQSNLMTSQMVDESFKTTNMSASTNFTT